MLILAVTCNEPRCFCGLKEKNWFSGALLSYSPCCNKLFTSDVDLIKSCRLHECVSLITCFVLFPFTAGKLRYANNSNYKNDVMIRKEVTRFPLHAFISVVFKDNVLACFVVVGVRSQERDGGTEEDH